MKSSKDQKIKRSKDQMMNKSKDQDKLTGIWEIVSGDLFEPMFHEWISRLEYVIEHETE
jgi:hypothetical protein